MLQMTQGINKVGRGNKKGEVIMTSPFKMDPYGRGIIVWSIAVCAWLPFSHIFSAL